MAVAHGSNVHVMLAREDGGPFIDITAQVLSAQTVHSADSFSTVTLEMIAEESMLYDVLDIPGTPVEVYHPKKKAFVICEYCGQWGAMYTVCRHCGVRIPWDDPSAK